MWSVCNCFSILNNLQPTSIKDLRKVDSIKACEYFNNCFKDPSAFTVVIVGNIDPTIAIPLILQYLVSRNYFSTTQAYELLNVLLFIIVI